MLLNFSRDGIVDNAAVLDALDAKQLKAYVCDFPSARFKGHPAVVAMPHLGASTAEAEDNCAVMVVDQVRDYLENGNIRNAVNFPDVVMARESPVPARRSPTPMCRTWSGRFPPRWRRPGLNIHNMLNKSRQDMAYTLVDVDSAVPANVLEEIAAIAGVLAVRYLPEFS